MAEPENDRIYIDDVTGGQIASPADATNGGATMLRGADAKKWLEANKPAKVEEKEVSKAKTENKARKAPETK